MATRPGFAPIGGIDALNRVRRQASHRPAEVTERLRGSGDRSPVQALSGDAATHGSPNDLHRLLGVVSGVAELQAALPGEVPAPSPLRLALDRRPFI